MNFKKLGLFAAGTLFGTAGIKVLTSKDARKVYTEVTAAALRAEAEGKASGQSDLQSQAEAIRESLAGLRTEAAALEAEGMDLPCEINVLLTDDEGIHQVNLDMRGVDRPTDVLSFPMFDLSPGEKPGEEHEDPDTGLVPLGDMCISLERAAAQAEEYGHSVERELSYLAVHSVLHLLGYDHMDEGPMKAQMRRREEHILEGLGIRRG